MYVSVGDCVYVLVVEYVYVSVGECVYVLVVEYVCMYRFLSVCMYRLFVPPAGSGLE